MRENIFTQLERLFDEFIKHRLTKVDFFVEILGLIKMASEEEKGDIDFLFNWLRDIKHPSSVADFEIKYNGLMKTFVHKVYFNLKDK